MGKSGTQIFTTGVMYEREEDNFALTTLNICNNNTRRGTTISWVLLDNQIKDDIFSNRQILTDIKTTGKWMKVNRNTGINNTNTIKLKSLPGDVWYHPNVIDKIISMAEVEKYLPVTYVNGNCLIIYKYHGNNSRFIK